MEMDIFRRQPEHNFHWEALETLNLDESLLRFDGLNAEFYVIGRPKRSFDKTV